MITLKGLTKQYNKDTLALDNISAHIGAGEFVSIVGQSGTGKTTLIKILIAEEKPTAGTVEIGGWDISGIRKSDIPFLRRQIGVIFQDFKLLPNKTAYENIAF
ncbi:MAG TPA: cell division ATP-binding protein FtsE, partial [Candidatus Magasanikbacteria bacterium]|nr:cell division ATP-binding protein FtsE [Candidatus Magasanikbacteria bacterium]